jgi:hypothetical protein
MNEQVKELYKAAFSVLQIVNGIPDEDGRIQRLRKILREMEDTVKGK